MYQIIKEGMLDSGTGENGSGAENAEAKREEMAEKRRQAESIISSLIYEDLDTDINDKENENVKSGSTDKPKWSKGFANKVQTLLTAVGLLTMGHKAMSEEEHDKFASKLLTLSNNANGIDDSDNKEKKEELINELKKIAADILIEIGLDKNRQY